MQRCVADYVYKVVTIMLLLYSTEVMSVIGYPRSGCYGDFFAIRFAVTVNDVPTEIRGNDHFAELYSVELQTSVSLSAVANKIASLVASSDSFDIRILQCFYDKHAPILSVEFPPQKTLENVKSLLSQKQKLSQLICLEVSSIFALNKTRFLSDVAIELFLCSPNDENRLNRLTSGNARYYVDMFQKSLCFEFPNLIEQISTGRVDTGVTK